MFVYFLQCFILFLPIALAKNFSNTTSSLSLPTEDVKVFLGDPKTNKTTSPLITEGGPITLLNTSIPAPKEYRNDLLSLDKTLLEVEEHTVSPSHSKIKPRKGAGNLNDTEENSTNEHHSTLRQDTTNRSHTIPLVYAIKNQTQNISKNATPKDIKVPHAQKNQTIIPEVKHKTEKVLPKKPLLVSYDKLASMDEHSAVTADATPSKMSETQSTAKPKAETKELPKHSTPVAMKSSMLSAGHPEMVIPVVITMIVVPMFALLGYMALKRGKEAWQNRHYKRMDFLLDGMYND